jgi:hypothetical protein
MDAELSDKLQEWIEAVERHLSGAKLMVESMQRWIDRQTTEESRASGLKSLGELTDDATRLTELAAYLRDGGWLPIESAPKDGTEFQAWTVLALGHEDGVWEPRCRFNRDSGAFEVWGRVDYDQDGWDVDRWIPTHWMPEPSAPPAALATPGGEE